MPSLSGKAPNISKFSESIRFSGTSKQSRYYVELSIPNVVSANYGGVDLEMINMFVEQTMFPEFVIATQQTRSHSNPVEMPYDRIFGPVTMTFLCDSKMTVKHFFDTWIQGVYSSFGGVLNYYDDYVVPEINIYKIDEQNQKIYCVTLYNAYPKVVNDIMLASNSQDLSRFQVVFSYEMWKSFVIEGGGYGYVQDIINRPFGKNTTNYGTGNFKQTQKQTTRSASGFFDSAISGVSSSITSGVQSAVGSIGNVIGSMAEIPSIDFIASGLTQATSNSSIDIMKNGMGIHLGLETINKLRNPALIKDAMRRAARSAGHEILKGPKAAVLEALPKSIRQIGGSVLGRVGGAIGL